MLTHVPVAYAFAELIDNSLTATASLKKTKKIEIRVPTGSSNSTIESLIRTMAKQQRLMMGLLFENKNKMVDEEEEEEEEESEKAEVEKKYVEADESEKAEVEKKSVEVEESEKAQVDKKSVIETESAEPLTKEVDVIADSGMEPKDSTEPDNGAEEKEPTKESVTGEQGPTEESGTGEIEPTKESGTGEKEPKPGTGEEAPPKELSLSTPWNNRITITGWLEDNCIPYTMEPLRKPDKVNSKDGDKEDGKIHIIEEIIIKDDELLPASYIIDGHECRWDEIERSDAFKKKMAGIVRKMRFDELFWGRKSPITGVMRGHGGGMLDGGNGQNDYIFIIDNGCGMDPKKLKNWAIYRLSKEDGEKGRPRLQERSLQRFPNRYLNGDISCFGVGGKQAAFFIGETTRIITKSPYSPDVNEIILSRDDFVLKEMRHQDIYRSCMVHRMTGFDHHILPEDGMLRSVIKEERGKKSFTCVAISDLNNEPVEYIRNNFESISQVLAGMKKKEEADKIDLFMYLMGDRADDIFRTFKFEKEEEATKIDSVLKAFDSHFCVRKNIIYERAKFNSRIQEDREPVDEFITSLYKLADSCEFEGLHEQLIRDRIVVGVRDKALSERMQLDSELTLEKAVKMVRQQEAVRQQQVDLQRPSTSQKVNQVKFNSKNLSPKQQQQPSRKKEKSAKTRSRCPKCGGFTHREGQACRAEGQRCNLCSKTGHFANCCPDKQAKTAEVKAVSELDEEIGFLLEVSAVEDSSNLDNDEDECRRRWTAEIQVNGKQLKFKLDSQADVTCVPLCLFKKIMGQQRLVESDINLRAAEFSELQTVGMFISTLRNGNYEIKEKIYVIRRLSEPLLSRRACELLNLARRIEVVATRINPIKEFPEVFEGLGQIGNPYEIKLKPGAKPCAVHTPRRVPIPLMEKLRTRLEELEKAGIIAQVNVATEWCAPTVIAGKPNGDIRLCVDLSRLNEHVQREVHPMPVVEHMLGQLGEARFFSKLDANSGFHQIPLSPDCQHLTTFITPFGRYKYCRMLFGISLAPEYFQRVMSIILQGMDGVMCYLDDILIFASDSKTHDRILRLVLRKLKEAKVTLNKAKCVFGVPRINFLGHILDEDGILPDPAKIEAVAKMPAPTDVHGVRRFLGMVNHLGRFVENLSEIVAPLNQLLVKGQDFVWDCSQERAFRKLKELLTTQPILAAYDVRKPTMVSSDASSYGLGAVLKQEGKNGIWRPVAYSSRTMTPTEKRYAQIEKEALAITWACERFQDFLLGKRFRIETDHKPLIPLFSTKELSSLTPRLQRFRMRMMRFGFEIVHIPGKELLDADALSRQPLLTTEGGEDERPTSAHINAVLSSITDKDEMLTNIFEAQQEDTTLKAVVNYLEQGWPDKKKMSQALLSYWHVKDELGVQNGLLMRSCRLVIPASMKLEILDKLHAGHFGITKTRLRARETVWWPGISEEIAETVRKCSVCIQEAVSKHEPLIPTNFPSRPWQKIGMDLFKFENKWYLVVIDYYSRFPEMIQLDRLTASVVVRSCKSIFARHGVPETVVSDNGTQFGAAREFANFARQYGFQHVTSSPRFPQSNGMAEAGVKIAKLILKKNQDPSLGLLEYRSTPLENGYSPAELLMGRKLRTTLPIAPENLNPKLVDSQTLKRKEGRRRKDMKSRYDRRCGATDMEELSEVHVVQAMIIMQFDFALTNVPEPPMSSTTIFMEPHHVFHYYLHGFHGNTPQKKPKNPKDLEIKLSLWENQVLVKEVLLDQMCDDLESQYIRTACSTFNFCAHLEDTCVEGLLRYHPYLYNRETCPAGTEEVTRGNNGIFQTFWNGRLIPYTILRDLDWCATPHKPAQIPLECYNRISGALWTDSNFMVSTNKLTFINLEKKLKEKGVIFSKIENGELKRVDIAKVFTSWLKDCHEKFDKQIQFMELGNLVNFPERPHNPWTEFFKISWGDRTYKVGDKVKTWKTKPLYVGAIKRFLLYGSHTQDNLEGTWRSRRTQVHRYDCATPHRKGQMSDSLNEIKPQEDIPAYEPSYLYNESRIFPLSKLDLSATEVECNKIISLELTRLPNDLELSWPKGNDVTQDMKMKAGQCIGDLQVKILNSNNKSISSFHKIKFVVQMTILKQKLPPPNCCIVREVKRRTDLYGVDLLARTTWKSDSGPPHYGKVDQQ
ncbi:K02A2.6-like [Cordylochernes scorpioides]|uniref:RNA-directed DNA polymerase n=1 Tax=Cordylochernes scorpioides TaxID=51811 RepID=A0ABY6LGL4_9ARAC|nr:K02A2.6-like [Cordylochernes scorpioides]